MRILQRILEWADSQFHEHKFPNKSCDDCTKCLERMHNGSKDLKYECIKGTFAYVCKYLPVHAWERYTILKENMSILDPSEPIKMSSIGCGPYTDLIFLFEDMVCRRLPHSLRWYRGIDSSQCWDKVHNGVRKILEEVSCHASSDLWKKVFKQTLSVETYVEGHKKYIDQNPPNVLISGYFLSAVHEVEGRERAQEISKLLVERIVSVMPENSLVVLSDVNSKKYTCLMDEFSDAVQKRRRCIVRKSHFRKDSLQKYGEEIESPPLPSELGIEKYSEYHPLKHCRSANVVIAL